MTAVFSVVAMELSALNAMNILIILIKYVHICCHWMPFTIDSDYLAGSAKLALKKTNFRRQKAL